MASTPPCTFDGYARDLARRVLDGALGNDEAARILVAEAVSSGLVARAIQSQHSSQIPRHERDEFVSGATFAFVTYALPSATRHSPLDVRRFVTDDASASGWVFRTVGTIHPSRIRRDIASRTDLELLDHDEPRWDDYDLDPREVPSTDALADASRDLSRTGETLTLIHASVLHQLFDGPALRTWELSESEARAVRIAICADPDLPHRVLAGRAAPGEGCGIRRIWASWDEDCVSEALAKSSPERNIPELLTRAALGPLPRPPAGRRGAHLKALRERVVTSLSGAPRDLAATLFDGFLAARVAQYTDKDRHRRPLSRTEQVERVALAAALPSTLSAVAAASGVSRLDLVSGLGGLMLDPIPVLDSRRFTPTTWRFP